LAANLYRSVKVANARLRWSLVREAMLISGRFGMAFGIFGFTTSTTGKLA
jgi:hypothetical protein